MDEALSRLVPSHKIGNDGLSWWVGQIEAGDHHDPNVLEVFCDVHPDEPECLIYDD